MDQELLVRQIMQEVLKNMQGAQAAPAATVTAADYPLGEKMPEKIKSASGKTLDELTLDKVISGELTAADFRITKETLELQAQVAESQVRAQALEQRAQAQAPEQQEQARVAQPPALVVQQAQVRA